MAKGKFSAPRSSGNEEREIEAAFRQAMGEDVAEQPAASTRSLSEDDILADALLDELLNEEHAPETTMEALFPEREPSQEKLQEETTPETTPEIRRNKRITQISLIAVALVLVVGLVITGVFFLGGGLGDSGKILPNVTVAGINLGGLTQEEAIRVLHAATDSTYTSINMVVILPDGTMTFTPAQSGANLDVEAAVAAAYDYGRTGSLAERKAAKAHIETAQYHIGLLPYLSLNTEYIRQQLDEYGAEFNSSYCDSAYAILGDMPALEGEDCSLDNPCQTLVLNAGSPGRHLDINVVYNKVLDAYSFHFFEVDVSKDAPVDTPEPLDLQAIWEELYREPVNAVMDMETFEILPETYGYGFDISLAEQLLSEVKPGTEVHVPMEYVIPDDTTETLSAVLFRDQLAYVETPHTNNANRNNNLVLACQAINGVVLMPGEVFSYNDTLGKRTAEAGYKAAAAYVGGETVLELGGGICQVSSTLYYATLLADMEIVIRSAHGFVSSYIDFGMDATVSWGGPEFKFANSSIYPIRIQAEVSDGYVKVWIFGTDTKDYFVEMEYEILSITPYETVYEDYPEDNEKGYKDGDVVQTPYTGYVVKTYRCKYSKETGELISRELEATSRYNVRDLVIARVGAEEEEEPSEGTDDPTDPVPTDPTPTDPVPTDPAPTDPVPTDPTPTPTEPAPTETPAEGGE